VASASQGQRGQGLHILTRVALTLAPICEAKNLTLSQYRHLFLIAEAPRRAAALADAFEVSRPMVAMSIRALEERGLVARKPVPEDGRGVEIHMTAAGRRLLREVERALMDHLYQLAGKDNVERLLEDATAFQAGLEDMFARESLGERMLFSDEPEKPAVKQGPLKGSAHQRED
jgi:DNA-binding MarR family transcriptional regulator